MRDTKAISRLKRVAYLRNKRPGDLLNELLDVLEASDREVMRFHLEHTQPLTAEQDSALECHRSGDCAANHSPVPVGRPIPDNSNQIN